MIHVGRDSWLCCFLMKIRKREKVRVSKPKREKGRKRARRRKGESYPPSCRSSSVQTGCKPSSLPLCNIHSLTHPTISTISFIPKGVTRGDKTRLQGACMYGCVCTSTPYPACAYLFCLWNRWHEELKQTRQKDENAPVSQPKHPLLGPGGPLHDPAPGRLRDLLQHPGIPNAHVLSSVVIANITWTQQITYTGELKYYRFNNPILFIIPLIVLHLYTAITIWTYCSTSHAAVMHWKGCMLFAP